MRTNVYIDGFNLYYGALQGTPFKWLDPVQLATLLFPEDEVSRICYCTAPLKMYRGDGGPRQRQLVYLDALRTLPNVQIVHGTFRNRTKRRPLLYPIPGLPNVVEIFEWEEKKTDVNLATEMIFDVFSGACDQIAVITNDSDLSGCLQRIRDDLHTNVVVVNPSRKVRTPRDLYQSANRVFRLREYHLERSQLPDGVRDAQGRMIRKPASW